MGFFDDLLGVAAPVLSIAGLPAWGAGAAAVGALRQGKKAQKKADRYASQQEAILAKQRDWLENTAMPMLDAFLKKNGWNPTTGEFDVPQPYASVPNPYTANLPALAAANLEDTDLSTDQSIDALLGDFLARGQSIDSSFAKSAAARARQQMLSDTIGFRRGLGVKANEWDTENQRANIDESWRRTLALMDAANAGTAALGGQLGGIGGLGNLAQSQADAAGTNFAGLIGTVADVMGRGKDAGDNRLGTNQSPTPIGGSNRGGYTAGIREGEWDWMDDVNKRSGLPVFDVLGWLNRGREGAALDPEDEYFRQLRQMKRNPRRF